jgi:hypothetical protein
VSCRSRAIAVLLLAAGAAPFWAGRFLPFLDLPQHLGLAAVVTRYRDPATAFARTYLVQAGVTPYWGYYGSMWLLGRALPLELANRLLFSAYAVGLPLAAAFLLSSFRRDPRWAVFTLPLVFSTNLFLGFASFLLSLPLALLALGLAERHLAAPGFRLGTALGLAAAAALVFLFHAQSYLVLGLCVLVLFAVHLRGLRWAATRALAFLPSLTLFALWFVPSFVTPERAAPRHTAWHRSYGGLSGLGAAYEPWQVVLRKAPERIFGSFGDGSDRALGAALAAVFAVALLVAYGPAHLPDPLPASRGEGMSPTGLPPPAVRGEGRGEGRLRRFLLAHRCDLLVLALVASYLLAPMEISGQWYVNPRHLVFAALAAPLLLARAARGWRAGLAALAAVLALATSANAARQVRAFQRQVGPFEEVAAAFPPAGRVLGLPFDDGAGGPVRLWPFLHFACYAQLLAGADVGFSFAGLPSIPVRYRPGQQAPHPYEWRPEQLDWATMGPAYDAFLVSGTPRGRGGEELRRHAEPVARAGPFTLWRPRPPR